MTLGPKARNVVIEKSFGSPTSSRDGVLVIKEIELENKFENLGAQMVNEVQVLTARAVGDGTKTATVLADAIFSEGSKLIAAGHSPMELKRGIEAAVGKVVESLKDLANPARTESDLITVATLGADGDVEIGTNVAKALLRFGKDTVVTVVESGAAETAVAAARGYQFDRGQISPYFVTDPDRMECVLEHPYVLLHQGEISNMKPLLPMMEHIAQHQRSLLLIADDVEGEALATLVVNKIRGVLRVCAVRAPGFGERRTGLLHDIAAVTGARVTQKSAELEEAPFGYLGSAKRAVTTPESTTIIEGEGTMVQLDERDGFLRKTLSQTTSDYDREKLEERLAKLRTPVVQLGVAASSEATFGKNRALAENALRATRAALEEGVVPGGGVALIRAQRALDGLSREGTHGAGIDLVRRALEEPLRRIAANAGADGSTVIETVKRSRDAFGFDARTLKFADLSKVGVVDATKVVRTALENASSVASLLLTTEALVAESPKATVTMGPSPVGHGPPDHGHFEDGNGDGDDGNGGGDDGNGGDGRVTRYTDITCPSRVARSIDRFPVTVALTAQPMTMSAHTTELKVDPARNVEVFIDARGFEILGPARVSIAIDGKRETFLLKPTQLGFGSVTLDFSQDGHPLGTASMPVETVDEAIPYVASARAPQQLDVGVKATPLDFTLSIATDGASLRLWWREQGDVDNGRAFAPVPIKGSPTEFVRQQYDALDVLRKKIDPVAQRELEVTRTLRAQDVDRTLKRFGQSLWQKLIPAELKTLYGQKRDQWKNKSLVILSDEPAIPWELVWPYSAVDGWEDTGPWCVTFRLARWLRRDEQGNGAVGPPGQLTLSRIATVIPTDSDLHAVTREGDFLRSLANRHGIERSGIEPPLKPLVIQALESSGYDWLHAAAHGQDGSATTTLWLENQEALTPDEIVGPQIEGHIRSVRPGFVLNACDVGRAGWTLTGISGWASQLISVGAGLFLAPLWSVTDAVAAGFVQTFYDELARGALVGDAMRAARADAREQSGDPTWMAYVLYAHPNARVVFKTALTRKSKATMEGAL